MNTSEVILASAHEVTARRLAKHLSETSIFSYQDCYGAAMAILFTFDFKRRAITEEQLVTILKASRDMSITHARSLGFAVYHLLDLIFSREVVL